MSTNTQNLLTRVKSGSKFKITSAVFYDGALLSKVLYNGSDLSKSDIVFDSYDRHSSNEFVSQILSEQSTGVEAKPKK